MLLKVCGMREHENIKDLLKVSPDWMGLIFYPKSKRFVGSMDPKTIAAIQASEVAIAGVFVNPSLDEIKEKVITYHLDMVQLHGNETLALGKEVKNLGVEVIKVFGIKDYLPMEEMKEWVGTADYFLFDTKSKDYGGTGRKFDWSALKGYNLEVPFLLSGGIDVTDIEEVRALNLTQMIGIDTNSKMEISPGLKDMDKVRKMKELVC